MRRSRLVTILVGLAVLTHAASASAQGAPFNKQHVTFKSGSLTLVGYLFKPAGTGPFPAILWNHGSEPNPGSGPQFDSVAAIFVPAGFAVFAPMRRGHSDSEGEYIVTAVRRETDAHGPAAGQKLAAALLETSQLDDQLAGLQYLKALSFVDTTRLAVAGCSYGGIQTLLSAERRVGFRAAVPISPAAQSWAGNPALRERMKRAAEAIDIPVFLIQPPKGASLEPARVLGPILERRTKANRVKVYPETGPEDQQTHCFGGAKGMHTWAADVLDFVKARIARPLP